MRNFLFGVFGTLLAAQVFGQAVQPVVQYGHRLGSVFAFLAESPGVSEPAGDPRLRGIPPGLLGAIRDPSVTLSAEQLKEITALAATNTVAFQPTASTTRADLIGCCISL